MKWSFWSTTIWVKEEYNEPGIWWQRRYWCHATAQFFPSAILDHSLSSKYEGKSSCRSILVFSFSSCSMLLKFKVSPRGIILLKVGSNFGWRVICHESRDAWNENECVTVAQKYFQRCLVTTSQWCNMVLNRGIKGQWLLHSGWAHTCRAKLLRSRF